MYRYGISYYTAEEDGRKPQSGLDVRLLRPGADWQTGIHLLRQGKSGYYECLIKKRRTVDSMRSGTTATTPTVASAAEYCTIGSSMPEACKIAVYTKPY